MLEEPGHAGLLAFGEPLCPTQPDDRRVNTAYGFTIVGLADTDALRTDGDHPADQLVVRQTAEPYPGEDRQVLQDRAVLRHHHGATVVDRATSTMTIHGAPLLGENELVHPFLWPGAALCAYWMGRETIHGGAFLDDDGGGWVILGDSGDGKSTLLATLALSGREVLADDLVVIEGDHCFAGPRCIDLLPESVAALGCSGRTSPVRWSHRERLALPPIVGRVPVRGFVHLAWSQEDPSVTRLPPRERVQMVARHRRVLELGVDPLLLLDLASAPALLLTRPRDRGAIGDGCALLVAAANERR